MKAHTVVERVVSESIYKVVQVDHGVYNVVDEQSELVAEFEYAGDPKDTEAIWDTAFETMLVNEKLCSICWCRVGASWYTGLCDTCSDEQDEAFRLNDEAPLGGGECFA